VKLKNFWRTKK